MLRLISPSNLLEICRYFRPDPEGLDLPLESSSRVQIRYAGPIELDQATAGCHLLLASWV